MNYGGLRSVVNPVCMQHLAAFFAPLSRDTTTPPAKKEQRFRVSFNHTSVMSSCAVNVSRHFSRLKGVASMSLLRAMLLCSRHDNASLAS